MSSECDRPARQRFKGIENFLRRVAFNLGNTPSQTEVKIISCIPIDVTDLQQKINALEKELSEVREVANYNDNDQIEMRNVIKNPKPTRAYTSIVQTALGKPQPVFSKPKVSTQCKYSQAKTSVTNHGINTKLEKGKCGLGKRKLPSLCIVSSFSTDNEDIKAGNFENQIPTASKKCCKIVPKRLRRAMRKKKGKTHMIYFTDASKTPFNNYNNYKTSESVVQWDKSPINKNTISRAYINNMIRKQYESEILVDDLTDISQISTPACRDSDNDESPGSYLPWNYESFKDLDRISSSRNESFNFAMNNGLTIDQGPIITQYHFNNEINYSGYYDSNYYDIYPVKEKSMKYKKEETSPKQIKRLNSDGFSEPLRVMNNLRPIVLDDSVSKRQYKHQSCKINDGNSHELTLPNVSKKRNRNNEYPKVNLNESKLCSIEYGNVYLKRNHVIEGMEKLQPISPTFKNAECLTLNTNNMESQTVESKGVQLNTPEESNKAEIALEQIKTILQSVLAEVKTNLRSNSSVDKQKRSVPIQKDVSRKNVTRSSALLHSCTYNPSCTMNPCLTSYSRHLHNFCYPNYSPMPMKCVQHYPLLVPPIKHFGCNCHHKNKLPADRHKKATNTETEAQMMQKSETMNLIKEIYNSVPLNVYYSNKATSRNSFAYQKSNSDAEVESQKRRDISVTGHSNTDDVKDFDARGTTPTSYSTNNNTNTILESVDNKQSRSTINQESVRSVSHKDSQTTISLEEEKVDNAVQEFENDCEQEESESEKVPPNVTDSETDSDGTLVAEETTQKKEKPGLLKKVLQTVKKLKRKKIKWQKTNPKGDIKNGSVSDDSETDSQTVYSYKTYKHMKTISPSNPKQLKSTIQSNRDISRPILDFKRLSPYMEQEYRRYWDEKLMFNDAKPKLHSSERSFPSWTRSPHTPYYLRNFEARSAIFREQQLKFHPENRRDYSDMKEKPSPIQQKEKTGLKLEWMKKHKNKITNK